MREANGDLFRPPLPVDAIVVPTNLCLDRRGRAIMGAGVAGKAARLWPLLAHVLGEELVRNPDGRVALLTRAFVGGTFIGQGQVPGRTQVPGHIIAFPTKRDWRWSSPTTLVERSARELRALADHMGFRAVALPRVGAGLGGLDYEREVRPILQRVLDDRFVLLHLDGA